MCVLSRTVLPISRRTLLSLPLAVLPQGQAWGPYLSEGSVERTTVGMVERDDGLTAPLTLGMGRIIVPPGAFVPALTPVGTRMIVVEAGVLAVSPASPSLNLLAPSPYVDAVPAADPKAELLIPAGTTMTFGPIGVAGVRNPGSEPVIALDMAVYHDEPRPIRRTQISGDGFSFQLLASGYTPAAPSGRVLVTLERIRLGSRARVPLDLMHGIMLAYVRAGSLQVRSESGEIVVARGSSSAPYAQPGIPRPMPVGDERGVNAGGRLFLPAGAEAIIWNANDRSASLMTLSVRGMA